MTSRGLFASTSEAQPLAKKQNSVVARLRSRTSRLVAFLLLLVTWPNNLSHASSQLELNKTVKAQLARIEVYSFEGHMVEESKGVLLDGGTVLILGSYPAIYPLAVEIGESRYETISQLHFDQRRFISLIDVGEDLGFKASFDTTFEWAAGDSVLLVSREGTSHQLCRAVIGESGLYLGPAYRDYRFITPQFKDEDTSGLLLDVDLAPILNFDGEMIGVSMSPFRSRGDGKVIVLTAGELLELLSQDFHPIQLAKAGEVHWGLTVRKRVRNFILGAVMNPVRFVDDYVIRYEAFVAIAVIIAFFCYLRKKKRKRKRQ